MIFQNEIDPDFSCVLCDQMIYRATLIINPASVTEFIPTLIVYFVIVCIICTGQKYNIDTLLLWNHFFSLEFFELI